jgi:hypothetical protein
MPNRWFRPGPAGPLAPGGSRVWSGGLSGLVRGALGSGPLGGRTRGDCGFWPPAWEVLDRRGGAADAGRGWGLRLVGNTWILGRTLVVLPHSTCAERPLIVGESRVIGAGRTGHAHWAELSGSSTRLALVCGVRSSGGPSSRSSAGLCETPPDAASDRCRWPSDVLGRFSYAPRRLAWPGSPRPARRSESGPTRVIRDGAARRMVAWAELARIGSGQVCPSLTRGEFAQTGVALPTWDVPGATPEGADRPVIRMRLDDHPAGTKAWAAGALDRLARQVGRRPRRDEGQLDG